MPIKKKRDVVAEKKKMIKKRAAKKTKPNGKGTGRDLIKIDWDTVDKMCSIQCTGEEIASVLNIDYDTLERACKRTKKTTFADYIGKKKQGGRASLRRRQWQSMQEGNPTMLIWLGKNYLGQRDQPEPIQIDEAPTKVEFTIKAAVGEITVTNARKKDDG